MLVCEFDIGDEWIEMFEIYSVLYNFCCCGYVSQVGWWMNFLFVFCDDEEDEEGDDWDEDDD